MRALTDCFALKKGDCAALVGSGGKTSLMFALAKAHCRERVLVSTTTKIGQPSPAQYDRFLNGSSLLAQAACGVTVAANVTAQGKLCAPCEAVLREAAARYDLALLESDGSRNLPLKGWAEHEPVIPDFVSLTVGLIPVWAVGHPATEAYVHRLPLFCALTGISPGETIRPEHLAAAICGEKEKGLFTASVGRKILLFNQIEDEAALRLAGEVTALLPAAFRGGLDAVVAGSVHKNQGWIL